LKIHLIGVCGTGMGSLAGLLKAAGHDVRGSDEHVYPPMSTQLKEQQIPVFDGFAAANLDWSPDRVVVGNVCRKDHLEVLAATALAIPLTSFPAILSELFLVDKHSVVVAGTHGKTTTASLLAHLLTDAGRDPSFLIGGVPLNFRQSWRLGQGEHFVVEGDEYDTAFFDKGSKFFHYRPRTVILTSVEFDHADIFADEAAVKAAFRQFVALIPVDGRLLVCAGSPGAMEVARVARCAVETYGRPGTKAEWTFEVAARRSGGRTTLAVAHGQTRLGEVETNLPGIYNHENLLGALAIAMGLGVGMTAIAGGVRRFLGIRRRQELRGVAAGVTVVDDFAHHPTAIRETLLGLRGQFGPGKLIAAFEPRSATSRRAIFQVGFAEALAVADEVVLAPLYAPEKIPAEQRLDVDRLAADLRREDIPARVIATIEETVTHLAERAAPGDTIVIMSSGEYGGLHDKVLAFLGDPVMPARADDKSRIAALLDRLGIAHPVLDQFWPSYFIIPGAVAGVSSLVGCVALEIIDDVALLRMLAVAPERRGEGLGYLLVETATERARNQGVKHLYLVTDGAQGYFGQRLGFAIVDRKVVGAKIAATAEYLLARSKNATWMHKEL
jgi:UDP-N-acetylmuramate: L-alanyl-gamma-D-glutamyl-meso-diaminopimelate ligase